MRRGWISLTNDTDGGRAPWSPAPRACTCMRMRRRECPLGVGSGLTGIHPLSGSSWADSGQSVSIDRFRPRNGQSTDQKIRIRTGRERPQAGIRDSDHPIESQVHSCCKLLVIVHRSQYALAARCTRGPRQTHRRGSLRRQPPQHFSF